MKPTESAPASERTSRQPCPDRIEVDRDETEVPAATVKAWVAHLRSHGWADADLAQVWLTRAKQGVTR